jgi:glutamate---cysteine ligase / carboxylate-amine ligase
VASTFATAAGSTAAVDPAALTVGVEEEFLLADPDTGVNRPVAEQVTAALSDGVRGQSRLAGPAVPPGRRYQAMADRYGPVALDPAVCGLHVHVGVPDRELAVQVCNHLQAWLPVIRALGGNSPLYQGADTGHASWRSVQLLRWPGVGPTPVIRLGRRLPPYGRGADRRRRDAR